MVYLEEEGEGIHDALRSVVVNGCSEISLEATRHVRLQLAEGGGLERLEVDLDLEWQQFRSYELRNRLSKPLFQNNGK